MHKVFAIVFALQLLVVGAMAQNTRQPASLTITPTTLPEVLQVLDNTGAWVTIGTVNPTYHSFNSVGGANSMGMVNVVDPTVGMVPNTGVDNAQFFGNLNAALSGPTNTGGGYEVIIPGLLGVPTTSYYFSQTFPLSKIARYRCVADLNGSVILYFAAGVNGIDQTGAGGRGSFEGCNVRSLGYGTSIGNPLSNTIPAPSMANTANVPIRGWKQGDSILATAYNRYFPDAAIPAIPIGTVVTAVNGDGSLVLSNPPSPFFGASVVSSSGQPAPNRGTAVFTEIGANNFGNLDKANVAGITYTFVTGVTVGIANTPNQVAIGNSFQDAATNLAAAVNHDIGEFVGYTPASPGSSGNIANPLATATFDGNYTITFTSNFGGPGVNTLPSVYTPTGTPAGSFANPTFTGADNAANCPSPCAKLNASMWLWQLPVEQAAHISSLIGNSWIAWQQGPLPATQFTPGDKLLTDAFPWGSTLQGIYSGSIFQSAGVNFNVGDQFTLGQLKQGTTIVGNDVRTFVGSITPGTTPPGSVLVGVDFPTSAQNLLDALANTVAKQNVTFIPLTVTTPATVATVGLGTIGPTWLMFHSTGAQTTITNAYVSTYTSNGPSAGNFLTSTFGSYTAGLVWQPGLPSGQLATVTHAPGGGETPMWLMYAGQKRMNASQTSDDSFTTWPIGQWGACSSGYNGANCDLARDHNNFHQLNFVGSWWEGNNYATASEYDAQYSDNFVADYIGGGTLGMNMFNANYESGESGSSRYGGLKFCGSQNHTTVFGGYITGISGCTDAVHVIPANPVSGIDTVGMTAGAGGGRNVLVAGNGDFCCGPLSFWSGNDLNHKPHGMFVGIGSGSALNETALTFDINYGQTPTVGYLAYNNQNKEWVWGQGVGAPAYWMKFLTVNSATYGGTSGNFGVNFPFGITLAGDGNNNPVTNSRLLAMTNVKPAGLFHRQGDTEINTVSGPGSSLGWYSIGGSSAFTGRISDGTGNAPGTVLDVYNKLVTSPIPTVITGGSGYVSSPGVGVANKSGGLVGTFANCETEPQIFVTASGVTGAITAVTSVSIAGRCVGTPVDAPWNVISGSLAAGSGADFRIKWTPTIGSGVLGKGQTLSALTAQFTGTITGNSLAIATTPVVIGQVSIGDILSGPGVPANSTITGGSGLAWTLSTTVATPVGPVAMSTNFNNVHIVSGSGNSWVVDQTKWFNYGISTISGQSWYPFGGISYDPVLNDLRVDVLRSGSSLNNDMTGRVTLVGGTKTQTLAGKYNSASPPNCGCWQVPSGPGVAATDACTVFADATVTPALLTFTGSGTDTVKYICVGRN